MTKNRGACALTRAGGSSYTIKLKSACRKPDLSLSGLDPVPLSKIGTHLLAFLVAKEKIGTLLLASEMPVPIPGVVCVEIPTRDTPAAVATDKFVSTVEPVSPSRCANRRVRGTRWAGASDRTH